MKRVTKIFSCLLALSAASVFLSSCSTNTTSKGKFVIRYYPGGYGTDWIEEYAKAVLAEEKGTTPDKIVKGVDYELIADSNPGADKNLKSSTSCPDLVFANSLSAGQISAGLIEPIQDVYETEITTSQGKMKIKDYLVEDSAEQFCYQKRYGQGERLAYGIPFTNIPISIAYNETLLQKVEHVSTNYTINEGAISTETNKWLRAPETVDELLAYFEDIDNYNSTNGTNIVQFGWSLADGANWFEPLYATWWAQVQGLDKENQYPGEGTYYDFWEYKSADIYKQTGIQKGLETVQKLIVKDGSFTNSHPNCKTYTIKDIQPAFARGEIAMCLTGDFFEHEYADILKNTTDTFKLMRIPSIDGAETNADGSIKKLTFVNTSNVLFIPANAKNKDIAKKFLIYSSQESQVISFLKQTGGIRSFNFNPYELASDYQFSAFQESTIDLYFHADDLLMKYPRNAADKNNISPIYFYEGVNEVLFSVIDYPSLLNALCNYTPKQICLETVMSGQVKKFECLYDRACTYFEQWNRIYGL